MPALLPSFSDVCVTSRMSSITWKANPSERPKALTAASCVGVAFALIAPRRTEVVRSAAVLFS